ncbi:MFS transporter [Streptomyces sp. NPDC007206]|uniref:MFS transporter n=1 Tax=Streptomyces sp. NPDC007206 TaxID=3154317 RepID=UPI0033FD6FDA
MPSSRSRRTPPRLSRRAAFGVLAVTTVVLMATASAPSPIYPLYRQRWGFSVTLLTVVFAVYVVGLLGALLVMGPASDRLGRRPVLLAALLLAAASTAIFWTADGVASLVVARTVQGVATGTAVGALAAGLVDLSPRRPHAGTTVTAVGTSVGLAAGAAVVGLLVESVARPDTYVFSVLTCVFLLLTVAVWYIPETAAPAPGGPPRFRPSVRIPPGSRHRFLAAVPALVAGWSVTGLFLALTPSVVTGVLHVGWRAAGGMDIAALFLAGGLGGMWSARYTVRRATLLGGVLLTLGSAGLAVAITLPSPYVYACGAVVAGLGVGLTYNGNLSAIGQVTTAQSRSGVFSAVYVVSYAALSLPALAAGLLAPVWGLRTTSLLYVGFVGSLSLITLVRAAGSPADRPVHRGAASPGGAGTPTVPTGRTATTRTAKAADVCRSPSGKDGPTSTSHGV